VQQPAFSFHPCEERRPRVRREHVKGGGLDAVGDRPLDGPVEHLFSVAVHAEHEAGVDHHAQVVKPADGRGVVAAEVRLFAVRPQRSAVEGLEAHEQAA